MPETVVKLSAEHRTRIWRDSEGREWRWRGVWFHMIGELTVADFPTSGPFTEVDPPLTPCPPWCQKPADHDWEDLWRNGLIRYHTWRSAVNEHHAIGVEEVEQHTPNGTVRLREIVLDVEAPTSWDLSTARKAFRIFGEAIDILNRYQTPEDGQVA